VLVLFLLTLVVLGSFGPLMRAAERGDRGAATLGRLEAFLLTLAAGYGTLLALFLFGLRCDESCDENLSPEVRSGEWFRRIHAWQWSAQLALAALGFAAAATALVLTFRSRYRAAFGAVVAGVVCFFGWALFFAGVVGSF
jgi:hypothetical protein